MGGAGHAAHGTIEFYLFALTYSLLKPVQRFFYPHSLLVGQTIDLLGLVHQLHAVLRLQTGAQIILLDRQGNEFLTEIRQLARDQAQGFILQQQPSRGEPAVELTLYQCSLKADKFEWVLQKGTELGVARFVPVISQRSIVRPESALLKKYERWQSILREAAEQCGRGRVPVLAAPLGWDVAVKQAQGLRVLPWEASDDQHPSLVHYLAPQTVVTALNVLIGPEGGLAPDEVAVACAYGWQVVSLGPRILRAETAAIASIAVIMANLGELG
ncbi:MAG: 16S rRNA (uracil(1498)-N(3))-methyltransferase [Chloroflexi bacterium]|nr:16S rRNA (uracil(1498)-N(3))-methyltransferase [Chloroflexota bacterium]